MKTSKSIAASGLLMMLTGCSLGTAGPGLRAADAPVVLSEPCAHPTEFLTANDWLALSGQLGDELILCEFKRKALLSLYAKTQEAIR